MAGDHFDVVFDEVARVNKIVVDMGILRSGIALEPRFVLEAYQDELKSIRADTADLLVQQSLSPPVSSDETEAVRRVTADLIVRNRRIQDFESNMKRVCTLHPLESWPVTNRSSVSRECEWKCRRLIENACAKVRRSPLQRETMSAFSDEPIEVFGRFGSVLMGLATTFVRKHATFVGALIGKNHVVREFNLDGPFAIAHELCSLSEVWSGRMSEQAIKHFEICIAVLQRLLEFQNVILLSNVLHDARSQIPEGELDVIVRGSALGARGPDSFFGDADMQEPISELASTVARLIDEPRKPVFT
jgi:hypothetical protein